jgi:hypothetical protein
MRIVREVDNTLYNQSEGNRTLTIFEFARCAWSVSLFWFESNPMTESDKSKAGTFLESSIPIAGILVLALQGLRAALNATP